MSSARCTILFQGDSITDAGRERSSSAANDPAAMGNGYAFLAMCRLLAERPTAGLRLYNRGISGNRVPDLMARWEKDCLALAPDVLGILIGVNDIWHKMDGRYAGSVADYEQGFGGLLAHTRQALPRTHLIRFPEFDQRRAAAARVAREAGATFVPFQAIFDRAISNGSGPEWWAADGVHPTAAGHQLMAEAWLDAAAPALTGSR
jgi:lysophospholipase L1-like esterase